MGDDVEIIRTPFRFDILTRQFDPEKGIWEGSALKAFQTADGTMHLRGIASSTIKDLHGDTILTSALEDMERQANAGLTIFGNHSYTVPEDDYGHVESASIKQAGIVDEAGDPIYDLAFDVVVNDENERAVKTWRAINKKSKLGLSIGAMIPEGGAVRDKKTGSLTISHVNLLETSIVGIPANPRSWIENAVKSFGVTKAASSVSVGTPELTLDTETGIYQITGKLADIELGSDITFGFGSTEPDLTASHDELPDSAFACISPGGHKDAEGKTSPRDLRHYPHHTPSGAVDKNLLRNALSRYEDPGSPKCGKAHLDAHAKQEGIGEDNNKSFDDLLVMAASSDFGTEHFHQESDNGPDVAAAATCPDCGRGKGDGGGCPNPFHSSKDMEPDVTDAKIRVIEVDTGDSDSGGSSSQGASSSDPAPASDGADDGSDGADGDVLASADTIVTSAAAALTASPGPEVTTMLRQLLDLTNALNRELALTREREQAATASLARVERQRDEIVVVSAKLISGTNAILQKLADQPVGRRTVFREAQNQFEGLEGVYSSEFLSLLRSKNP